MTRLVGISWLQGQLKSSERTTSAVIIDGNMYVVPAAARSAPTFYQNIFSSVDNAGCRLATGAEETGFRYSRDERFMIWITLLLKNRCFSLFVNVFNAEVGGAPIFSEPFESRRLNDKMNAYLISK